MGKQILLLGMSHRDASLHVVRNFLFLSLVIHNAKQLLLFSGSRFEGGCCD